MQQNSHMPPTSQIFEKRHSALPFSHHTTSSRITTTMTEALTQVHWSWLTHQLMQIAEVVATEGLKTLCHLGRIVITEPQKPVEAPTDRQLRIQSMPLPTVWPPGSHAVTNRFGPDQHFPSMVFVLFACPGRKGVACPTPSHHFWQGGSTGAILKLLFCWF